MPVAGWTADVHGIVDLEGDYLVGGSQEKLWLTADQTAPRLSGGENYRLINLDGIVGEAAGSKPESLGPPCEDTPIVRFPALGQRPPSGIAVSGHGWPLQPRSISRLSAQSPSHVAIIRDLLKEHGIREPKVQIDQIVRADLDGDGTDEVIIAASRYAEDPPGTATRKGDYALVLVRQIVAGAVNTTILHEEYHASGSQFGAANRYYLAAIADLNGDGTMEIVVRGRYYEGEWTDVFEGKGGRFHRVLTAACGV